MLTCFAILGGIFLAETEGDHLVAASRINEYRITDCGRHYADDQCLEGTDGNSRWSWQIPDPWKDRSPAAVLALCAADPADPLSAPAPRKK